MQPDRPASGAKGAAEAVVRDAAIDAEIRAPSALLMLLEGRALWEYGASLAAMPLLKNTPQGDGHPVLVFPGLAANDVSTYPLRQYLRERGYEPYPWNYGFNFGPRSGVLTGCIEHVREIQQRHGRKVSLLGWSLGGIYAREIAKAIPKLSRCVITLGTPFTGDPKATNAWRLYELVSRQKISDPRGKTLGEAPPVPTTSLYSKSDGIVAWQCSLNAPGRLAENIEIQASHFGMGLNPMALYAIADRLAQPEGTWKPFEADGARKWFFKTAESSAGPA
jgi:pimeloyl-ACP methyl ester carboxylesterase